MRPSARPSERQGRPRLRAGGAVACLVLAAALTAAVGCAGCGPTRTEALEDLKAREPEVRAEGLRRLGRVAREEDFLLFAKAASDPAAVVRRAAVESLGARRDPRAVELAAGLLGDPDPAVQEASATCLGRLPSPKARPYLIESYARRGPVARAAIVRVLAENGVAPDEPIRAEARHLRERNEAALAGGTLAERVGAAEELGRSGAPEAVARLRRLIFEPSVMLAAAAARGLGAAADPASSEDLVPLLSSQHPELREAAALALGALGDPSAIEPLARAAREPTPGAIAAALALSRLPESGMAACVASVTARAPGPAGVLARHAAATGATCDLSRLEARVQKGGAEALAALAAAGPLRASGLLPSATAAARDDASPLELRAGAIRFLGEAGGPAEAPVLLELLERLGDAVASPAGEREPAVVATIEALGALRHAPAVPALVARLGDPDAEVQAAAVGALGAIGTPEALAAVAAAAKGEGPVSVRLAAIGLLGRVRGPAAAEALVAAAGSADPAVRNGALRALASTGAKIPPAALESFARSGLPEAAVALGWLGYDEAGPMLLAALRSPAVAGRAELVEALGQLGDRDVTRALSGELHHDRPEVRVAACEALGRLGASRAREVLSALAAEDYYVSVRRAAARALAVLDGSAGR